MQALQTKLETLTNQNSDCKQHIEVLKESLNAKEQRANTLQTEVSTHKHTHAHRNPKYTDTHKYTRPQGCKDDSHSPRWMRLFESEDVCSDPYYIISRKGLNMF